MQEDLFAEVIEMSGVRLVLDEAMEDYYREQEWLALAECEIMVRDAGLPFDEVNVAWTKHWSKRVATFRTLVHAGRLPDPHASGWQER